MPACHRPQILETKALEAGLHFHEDALRAFGARPDACYSAASAVGDGPWPGALELCRSTLRPSERISLTNTLNDSGIPASNVSSPRTIASYTLVRPATSSDLTVSISCKVYAAP